MKAERLQHRLEILLLLALLSFGVLIRCVKISQPFVDAWSWRQSDVAMIAENFYRNGFNIFYPQINWTGNEPGFVGTEFPLVPFIASLLYVFFGTREWIGRSISIVSFAISVPFLYCLVRRVYNSRSASFAVAIYSLTPLCIFASRSFMPDMASLSFSIMALYLFTEWVKQPTLRSPIFAVTVAATNLAILVKLPALVIGLPLAYFAWVEHGSKMLFRKELWIFGVLSLTVPIAWYLHAYHIGVSYYPYHMFGSGGLAIGIPGQYGQILQKAAITSLTLPLSALSLIGLLWVHRGAFAWAFHGWLLGIACFMFIASGGHRHQWYLLPLVPVAAAFAGHACDRALSKIRQGTRSNTAPVLVSAVFLFSLSYLSLVHVRPLYESWAVPALRAANELNSTVPANALLIVADGGDPTCLYYSRRKGWHFLEEFGSAPADSRQAIIELEKLRSRGANYLVFTRHTLWWLNSYVGLKEYIDSRYDRVSATPDYIIFDLAPIAVRSWTSSPVGAIVRNNLSSQGRALVLRRLFL